MPFAEDMSVFFDTAVFGTAVTWGALTATGIFDAPAEDVVSGEVIGTDYSVTIPATVFPGIDRGETITVTGRGTFAVREVRPLTDGNLKRLVLGVA